jgi:ubiquinone/menaquinone biosynthesis C-methylase UbiE
MPDSERRSPAERAHSLRARAFGARAAAYAEHRPDYPANALRWGLAGSSLEPKIVLDLAAGTGKLTEGLVALDLEVTAVEPDPGMLAELSRRFPALNAIQGRAERIPLPTASVDAVFAGQAFHWFDVEPAMTEIARVLKPGGVLVPLWNHDDDSVAWVAEFSKIARSGVSRGWASGSEPTPRHPDFEAFQQGKFRHVQRRTAETLVETVATHSHMLVAEPEESASALGTVREFLGSRPETSDGEFELPIITTAFRALRH